MTLSDLSRYDKYERDRVATVGERAVVVGGSIAGLLAARVLADGFEEVTVVDRDPFPDEPVTRRGVPQSNHVHALLEAGRATVEDLLPGYGEQFLSAGGLLLDATSDYRYYVHGDFLATGPRRLPMYCGSRPLFEHVVRQQVAERDAVTLRYGCQFEDYVTDDGATAVEGVVVRDDGSDAEELDADLVVDATGRTSKTPTWLEDHGYAAPPVDEVTVDVAYSTVTIERPPGDRRIINVPPSPPRTRAGFAVPVEGDRWQVTIQGMGDDEVPTDAEGFEEFVASLPVSEIRSLLDTQPWVSEEVHHYPFPSNLRRRYEKLDRFPDGLLVVGDAIASFNPIHGQGMSVAALEALVLHHVLADGGTRNLSTRFFDRTAEVVDNVWMLATGSDFRFPQTEGPKPRGTDLFNRYVARLVESAHTDGVLTEELMRVFRLEKPPTALLRPSVVRRVLFPSG